jgi:tetratricopeptide (TPR) repeat protein
MLALVVRAESSPGAANGSQEALLARLSLVLAEERLVTLLGPVGIGKTHAARRWFRALRALGRATAWIDGGPSDEALGRLGALGPEVEVVFLDGCDAWTSQAAMAVRECLQRLPAARIVVTSRERLGLRDERVVQIPPLDAADAHDLFVAVARRVNDRWTPSAAEREAIHALVAAVDGVPVGIEMLARQTDLRGPEVLSARLRDERSVYALLTKPGDAEGPEDALLGAWRALPEEEVRALAACSAFRGGFEVEAFTAVVDADEAGSARLLRALAGRSWLRSLDGRRFAPLRIVRELGAEELDRLGLASATLERHARFYADQASLLASLAHAGVEHAVAWLRAERENLLEVGRRGHAPAPAVPMELARRALVALEPVCVATGDAALSALVERAVARLDASSEAPIDLPDDVRWLRGRIRLAHGDFRGAEDDFTTCTRAGTERACARATADLAIVHVRRGQLHEAELALTNAQVALERQGDTALAIVVAGNLGNLQLELGRVEEARATLDGVCARARKAGFRRVEALAANGLGLATAALGMQSEAREALERAVCLLELLEDPRNLAGAVGNLGLLLAEIGVDADARRVLARASTLAAEVGATEMQARAEGFGACVAWSRGELEEARAGLAAAVDRLAADGGAVRVHFDAALVVVDSMLSGPAVSRARLAALRALVFERPLTLALVALHSASFEVVDALDAAWRGDLAPAAAALAALERSLAEQLPTLARSMEGRTITRIVKQRVRAAVNIGPAGAEGRPSEASLVVAESEVRAAGIAYDLHRRPSARAILVRLLRERVARPGVPLPIGELVAVGWPGERILATAATNRVRVAASGLRSNGLEALLVFDRGGYLLDPRIAIGIEPGLVPMIVTPP